MSRIEICQEIYEGAKLLDAKYENKNWRQMINRAALDMSSCKLCILGQLYPVDWTRGLDALGIDIMEACEYGFSYNSLAYISSVQLTAQWREYLEMSIFASRFDARK